MSGRRAFAGKGIGKTVSIITYERVTGKIRQPTATKKTVVTATWNRRQMMRKIEETVCVCLCCNKNACGAY